MRTVNIDEAKRHLLRLVEEAAKGESFIIAKAGRSVVKVLAIDTPTGADVQRVGFMAGKICVPDDFDRMGGEEVELIFAGNA